MSECYFCGGYPNIYCQGECREPDYDQMYEDFCMKEKEKSEAKEDDGE